MARKLLILGAGQYGFVAKETAELMGSFDVIDFLDDNNCIALGKLQDCVRFVSEYDTAFVAIGNPEVRMKYLNGARSFGYKIATIVHPTAVIMPSAKVSEGCIVEANAVVNSNAIVEQGCLICAGAVVNHNAEVKKCCQIDCNAVVSARAKVPAFTKVMSGSVYVAQ